MEFHKQNNIITFSAAINECDPGNPRHDCEQICVDQEKGFKCACKDGYRLLKDDKNCTGGYIDINCSDHVHSTISHTAICPRNEHVRTLHFN